ncbi:hypothetical protein CBM2609_B90074 [Cupriavidus taiwanensis]|nr:hypothetical protein CBM2604_B80074 [Cupriavidus taiwanensis]SOZ33599.1 hypothetical protein CBM2609_B90074 [Cupriavidus taiwanensis]SOZ48873.1 hypothetical protein CBM2610_B70074 [Cupriavidus taiwanensis]
MLDIVSVERAAYYGALIFNASQKRANGLNLQHINPAMSAIDGNSETRVAQGRLAARSGNDVPQ